MRWVLGALGLGVAGWGVVLLVPLVLTSPGEVISLGGWLLGGPLLHDLLVAPVVGLVGLTATRVLPRQWRSPVVFGLVASSVLMLLAVPYLWRTFGAAANPGLHDRPYLMGLLIALAVLWSAVAAYALLIPSPPLRHCEPSSPTP